MSAGLKEGERGIIFDGEMMLFIMMMVVVMMMSKKRWRNEGDAQNYPAPCVFNGDDGGHYEDDDAEKENKEEMLMMYKMISQATLVTPGLCLASKWLPSLQFLPGDCQSDYNEDVSGCQDYDEGIKYHRCDLANSDLIPSSEDWFL